MRTILVATVTANGQILLTENMAKITAPAEALGVFVEKAKESKCMIMGRSTYDMIMSVPGMKEAYTGIEVVMLSENHEHNPNSKVVASPEQAIDYLENKGYESVVIAGGLHTYNSFLQKDMVTDMFLSVIPVVIGNGGILGTDGDTVINFKFAGQKLLTENIIQLHFRKINNI
ncbi:MAG: dihydrofolate reductase [Rikenellaceae bacterium]|nr:dihydrofolate reductase [Rikenellaceae bacterium]